MKVMTDPEPLVAHSTDAFYAAAEDVRQYAADSTAPVKTGRYRGNLKLRRRKRPNGPTARIVADVPYGGALERGAWVRRGRGVHIARANAPRPLARAGERFGEFFEARLGSTPIRSTSIVTHDLAGEVGSPGLDLGA